MWYVCQQCDLSLAYFRISPNCINDFILAIILDNGNFILANGNFILAIILAIGDIIGDIIGDMDFIMARIIRF